MAYGLWPCGLMTLHKIQINSITAAYFMLCSELHSSSRPTLDTLD